MKRIFVLVCFLLSVCSLSAQISHTANGSVDEQAQKLLSLASKKINTGTNGFSVTMVNVDANKKELGRVSAKVVYKSGKFKVSFDQQLLLSDGSSVWQINKEVKETTVSKASASNEDLMNPGQLLVNYSQNYKAKYIRLEQDGYAVVDLTPKKSKSYYKIRFYIHAKTGLVKKMEMFNYDGSRGEYSVSGFSPVKASDSDFVYRASDYPGFEVIDMR